MGILNKLSGISELAAEHGEMVDHMLEFVHWFMLVLFVGWTIFLGVCFWKFRRAKSPRANYHGVRNHASTHVEIGVIITEVVLLLGFAYPLWGRRVEQFPQGEEVVRVRAVGEQFRWLFHYPGPDGKFGRVSGDLVTATNTVGLDMEDPNAQDDFTSVQELVLPMGRPAIVGVTSKDVIHSFSVHAMRITQDATPGLEAHVWFTPERAGEWDIVCAQLCGSNHANMRATLTVQSQADFAEWFKEKTPKAAAPAQPETGSGGQAAARPALVSPPAAAGGAAPANPDVRNPTLIPPTQPVPPDTGAPGQEAPPQGAPAGGSR